MFSHLGVLDEVKWVLEGSNGVFMGFLITSQPGNMLMENYQGRGRRHNFKSGGYIYHCERSEQKIFGGVPPHMPRWGYNSYKERHTERHISDSVAAISYWSCSCIYSVSRQPLSSYNN